MTDPAGKTDFHITSFAVTALLAAIILVFACAPAQAQTDDDPNFGRGVTPNQYFQDFGTDNVNLLNGNVTFSIPIGPELKHNGDLSLQLALHYNSKIWDSDPIENVPGGRCAFLEGRSMVGLGWTLHVGRVIFQDYGGNGTCEVGDEIYFETPDGSIHRLFPRNSGDPNTYWETKDGSYLRAQRLYSGSSHTGWVVRYPNGVEYTCLRRMHIPWNESYADEYTCSSLNHRDRKGYHDCFRGYYTTKIEDTFGNTIQVQYKVAPHERCLSKIVFQNVDGFDKTIEFITADAGGVPGGYVTGIRVPAFHDNNAARTVDYVLHYDLADVDFPVGDSFFHLEYIYCTGSLHYDNILRLRSIDIPEGEPIAFDYDDTGELIKTTYPMGGVVDYLYWFYKFGSYYSQPKYTGSPPPDEPHFRETRGIIRRTYSAPGETSRYWTYERDYQYNGHYTSCPTWVKLRSPHPDPDISQMILTQTHYGYLEIEPSSAAEPPCENGLPVLVEYYDEADDIVKKVETFYESDGGDYVDNAWVWFNVRPYRTVTSWPQSGGGSIAVQELKEDYQGFGHYGTTSVYQAFDLLRREKRTWETTENQTGNPYYQNWFVNQLKTREVYSSSSSNSLCAWTVYENSSSTGKRTAERRYRTGTPPHGYGDLTRVDYSYNGDGNLTQEVHDGGREAYTIKYDYDYGYMTEKWFQSENWYMESRWVHKTTGLPIESYSAAGNPSGLRVEYDYDDIGRITDAAPKDPNNGNLYSSQIIYNDAPGNIGATIRRLENGATRYTPLEFEYDSMGNVLREYDDLPNTTQAACVEREYGPLGHVVRETIPGLGNPGGEETVMDYDALGRVIKKITPDTPPGRATIYDYDGLTITVTTPINGADEKEVRTIKDGLDRIVRVDEEATDLNGNYPEGWFITKYDYDGESRLCGVEQWSENYGGTETARVEYREYTYDYEGNLITSDEPETGAVQFSLYDPFGNAGQKRDAWNNTTDYHYDNAGRLEYVKYRPNGMSSDTVTFYQYDQNHSGGNDNACLGKLTTVTETEYYSGQFGIQEAGHYTEEYVYAGKKGVLSYFDATVYVDAIGLSQTWRTVYNFNRDGFLKHTDYPFFAGSLDNRQTIEYVYGAGNDTSYVTGVKRYAAFVVDNVSYHPNGRPSAISYVSGTTTQITPDSQWRPARIKVMKGSSTLHDSGTYEYDGLGRITAIGGDDFGYDSLSRLTHAWMEPKDPSHDDCTFSYQYDTAGNMTSRKMTVGDVINYPTFSHWHGSPINNQIHDTGFDYDGCGNPTEFVEPGTGKNYYLEYDGQDRLARASVGDSKAYRFIYLYDHQGRRILTGDLGSDTYTYHLRDHFTGKVLTEYEYKAREKKLNWKRHNAYLGRKLVYSKCLFQKLIPHGGLGYQVMLHRMYHHDHLDTPIVIVDTHGNLKSTHKYEPFGVEMPGYNNEPGESSHRFTGHERDKVTGLDYMFKRHFSQHLTRFLSTDPVGGDIGSSQSWNKYAYVLNDPINKIDPNGADDYGFEFALMGVQARLPIWEDGSFGGAMDPEKPNLSVGPTILAVSFYADVDYTEQHEDAGLEIGVNLPVVKATTDMNQAHFAVGLDVGAKKLKPFPGFLAALKEIVGSGITPTVGTSISIYELSSVLQKIFNPGAKPIPDDSGAGEDSESEDTTGQTQ